MKQMMDNARTLRAHVVEFDVKLSNTRARALYERLRNEGKLKVE